MKNKESIKKIIDEIMNFLGINPEIEIEETEENVYNVKVSGEDLNFLIGYRGQSLEALQSLLSLIFFRKTNAPCSIMVDINNYKDKKVERIKELTKGFIDKARFFQKEITLPVMNPWERRQVHTLVAEYDDIESESTGEEPYRRVVLKIKKF